MRPPLYKITFILLLVFIIQSLAGKFAMASETKKIYKILPILAGLASLTIPGLGQILLGDIKNGILHFVIFLGFFGLAYILAPVTFRFSVFFISLPWMIYSGVDAHRRAYNSNI